MNIFERIYDFNKQAGLLDKPYDDFLESSYQVEEALEGIKAPETMYALGLPCHTPATPKDFSRFLVASLFDEHRFSLSDVDRLDKACDAIVFAVGSIAKLGLTPTQIEQAVHIVMDSNTAKLGCPKDEHGKLQKPTTDFPTPEPRLQELLDQRQ